MLWVDNTRIVAIFAVIVLHVAAGLVSGVDNINSTQWWMGNVYDALVRWCVPVFVMLSGAVLLLEGKNESLAAFYKKRASRLLIPLLFWSLFFLAWTFFKGTIRGDSPSLQSLGKSLLLGSPYRHMWFLYMLIGLYLVTPFVRVLVRNTSRKELVYFVIALFAMAAINSLYSNLHGYRDPLFINWFLSYLPYFIFGHLITKSDFEPNRVMVLLSFALSVFLTAWGCFLLSKSHGLEKGLYFYDYLSITVIPMSISILYLLRKMTRPIINPQVTRQFAGLVLGIYLVHPIMIELLNYCGISALRFNAIISVPLISLLVFIASTMCAWMISKIPYLKRTM